MGHDRPSRDRPSHDRPGRDRLSHLLNRLPARIRDATHWLLAPKARWARIPVGLLLILGGIFSFLPLLGIWMLPLGLILLAEDISFLRRLREKALDWIEARHPHWIYGRHATKPQATES
ncbi:hypothetical protein ACELLULO517_21620 [Acidisoma cellulosilytica]|uniref:Transmembrane protein (PGPGW) n=1 Tax=Acidisoma cellulosilyticum TaxID=2802395 RepID=A0A963Z6A8_9PROT|nr:hypothetical protein [Acidisoma cellulosilyticum]MCB8882860.1 hypothetical protein [Acidisoma cellulosilyticum]